MPCKIKIILKCVLRQAQHESAFYGSQAMGAQPDIGEWYRIRGGDLLEVVAIDEDDGTIEVQHFDGTVEEMDLIDWEAQRAKGEIEEADAPEDWSGSVDVEGDEDTIAPNSGLDGEQRLAGGLDDLDLFEAPDAPL
jgi:hypothetical protein